MCAQSQGSLCKELSSTSLKKLSSLTGEALYEKYVSTMVLWPVLRRTTVLQTSDDGSSDLYRIAAAVGWTLHPSSTLAGDSAGTSNEMTSVDAVAHARRGAAPGGPMLKPSLCFPHTAYSGLEDRREEAKRRRRSSRRDCTSLYRREPQVVSLLGVDSEV